MATKSRIWKKKVQDTILLNTFPCECYTEQDYKKYCEEFDIPFKEEDYYSWQEEMLDIEIEDFQEQLTDFSEKINHICIITGSFGAWNGRRELGNNFCNSIEDAVNKILNQDFQYYIKIEIANGLIEVTQAHHDGRNHYTIIPLSKYGENVYYNKKASYQVDEWELTKRCLQKIHVDFLG